MKNSKMISKTNSGNKSKIHKVYNNLVTEFASKKWGYETLGLFAQSCLGGIAVMLILENRASEMLTLIELFLVTVFSMSFNAAMLIDLKAKPAFNILIASIFVSISMIIANSI